MGLLLKKYFCLKTTHFFLISAIFVMLSFSCSNLLDDTIQNDTIQRISIANADLPVARVEEPVFVNEGVAKNKAIIIRFSKPMDRQTFMESLSITDPIGTNLKSFFLEPQWSNNNKVVTIPANEQNLIDLRGKKTMDIYVTLLKTCTTVDNIPLQSAISDYKYRICDIVDNELPQMSAVKAMFPQKDSEKTVELVEGELTSFNEEIICTTNHINSKLNFYVEGSDYGGGEVFAHISFVRVFDVNGNPVEEEQNSVFYNLDSVNFLGNYFNSEICLDFSGEEFLDGMYKIIVTVADSSLLDSEDAGVYYVIRDTSMAYSANALMCFETPVEPQKTTISEIEYCRNRIKFDYVLDDIFYVSKGELEDKVYKEPYTDFTYYACWGKKPDFLCEPVILEAVEEELEYPVYSLPPAFKYYCDNNSSEDIFLQVTYVDCVGNRNSITTLIPKQIEFYNYEVLEGSCEETRKIRLNYADMSAGLNGLSKLEGKNITALYNIYYGKIEDEEAPDSDFSTIELAAELDPELEFNSKYVFYIQPVYDTTSQTNGQWCGQTYGPSCQVIINLSDVSEELEELPPEIPEFTIEKESAGQNTGLFAINIEIQNFEDDVSYVPCYSVDDGNNWIVYNSEKSESFSFSGINPLRAPLGKNEAWDNYNWQGDYFTAIENQTADYGQITAKVKLLAIRGSKTSESQIAELVFTQEDDNIPPAQSNIVSNHDSMLSFDGHSFVYNELVLEDEGHAEKTFTYYYMPYNEVWGNNLFIAQDQQIEMLPCGTSVIASSAYRGEKGALYSLNPVIPVNGLKDGKYMFFAKISDTYGNYRFITLGKANVGTFKNKLEVQYDIKNKNFISRLPLESSEKLDKNMINIQFWKIDEALWDNYYDKQNELQVCETINSNGKSVLYNQTKKEHYTTEYQYLLESGQPEKKIKKRIFQKELQTGIFYRFTMQGYNQHEYDGSSGVNVRYGMPYNDNPVKENIVPLVPGESEYDLCTEETVSNTVYYYLAAPNDNMKNFKASFFKNTASPRSNYPYIVNVISSLRDLGNDIDEWERRGKLVATHYYNPDSTDLRNNKAFNDTLASEYMNACTDKGLVYYAAIVHFADNSSVISNVYQMQN